MCMHALWVIDSCVQVPLEVGWGHGSPVAGCEPPNVGSGNQTQASTRAACTLNLWATSQTPSLWWLVKESMGDECPLQSDYLCISFLLFLKASVTSCFTLTENGSPQRGFQARFLSGALWSDLIPETSLSIPSIIHSILSPEFLIFLIDSPGGLCTHTSEPLHTEYLFSA